MARPFGIRKLQITPMGDDGATPDTSVMLDAVQRLGFTESEDFEIMRGEDKEITRRGKGPLVNWAMSQGGLSLPAYKAVVGGTLTTTGVSPNVVTKVRKSANDVRPWFKAEGQSISDSGGDVHAVIFLCKTTGDVTGEFADQTFWTTGFSGVGLPSREAATLDALYDIIENETETAIAPVP